MSYARTMPRCDLVVTHGGHGTLARALASGCPVVVCPAGGDMAENAARVDWAGWACGSRRASARRGASGSRSGARCGLPRCGSGRRRSRSGRSRTPGPPPQRPSSKAGPLRCELPRSREPAESASGSVPRTGRSGPGRCRSGRACRPHPDRVGGDEHGTEVRRAGVAAVDERGDRARAARGRGLRVTVRLVAEDEGHRDLRAVHRGVVGDLDRVGDGVAELERPVGGGVVVSTTVGFALPTRTRTRPLPSARCGR